MLMSHHVSFSIYTYPGFKSLFETSSCLFLVSYEALVCLLLFALSSTRKHCCWVGGRAKGHTGNRANLSLSNYVVFGYAAYGVGLVLGSVAMLLVLARKEADVEAFVANSHLACPPGCMCRDNIHSSFASIAIGGIGLLVWGIGFLGLSVDQPGSRFHWMLAVIGSLMVSIAITMHFDHLGNRFGRLAIATGILSAYIWSFGYLLQAINPGAVPTSDWYTYLFLCYGVGHLLTAVSMLLVARRKYVLEREIKVAQQSRP
jgi:hypothetical protein